MDIEKLKPWNWFKHEDDSSHQIPVSKNEVTHDNPNATNALTRPRSHAVGSLMQLHNEMDRLFDDVWRSFGVPSSSLLTRSPSAFGSSLFDNSILGEYRANLDVSGSEKEYEVSIDLPGLTENDIQIELNGNTLKVKGQKEEKTESDDKQYYRVERSVGAFQRTLSLPEDADREDISANMKNGLLVIRIPRKALPNDDTKKIPISS